MSDNAIVPAMTETQRAIEFVKGLMSIVGTLRQDIFKAGVDYGIIPGTNEKPVLLLPGMEKLLRALRLRPEYRAVSIVEDFDKPLFMYRYECRLYEIETGLLVSTAIGSANSYEQKWRYRNAKRVCPECGKPAIIKSKAEYGGGWLCFKKQGGCGAKFSDGDPAIEQQEVGRIENADIFDQINIIDKIAQKRALSSAIKCAANVSEFFTVDLDDFEPIPAVGVVIEKVDTDTGEIVEQSPTISTERAKALLGGNGGKSTTRPPIAPPDGFVPSAFEPGKKKAPETRRDLATYVEVCQTRDGKNFLRVDNGATTFTREPFRRAGIACENWTTPGEKHLLEKPITVYYTEEGSSKNIVKVTLEEKNA